MLSAIKSVINIIREEEYAKRIEHAKKISPDPDDVMYFALALKEDCPIWSNDRRLKEQDVAKIFSTHEILKCQLFP